MHGTTFARTQWRTAGHSAGPSDADAGKLAGRAQDALAQDAARCRTRQLPAVGRGLTRRTDALYTGRGPVCGTIMRGAGGGCCGLARSALPGAGGCADVGPAGLLQAALLTDRTGVRRRRTRRCWRRAAVAPPDRSYGWHWRQAGWRLRRRRDGATRPRLAASA